MSGDGIDHTLPGNSIAIVGVAGRFPGADSVEQFWRNLCAGVESISRFGPEELEDWFSEEVRGSPNYVKARPILHGVDQFDAGFFGMYSREAELTDPQHRIFLECAWEALEDAGYDPAAYPGAIGVFAGSSMNTYLLNNVCGERKTIEEFTSSYQVGCYPMLVGSAQDFLASRVSYKLDLKGPAITVQTACSTSLVAVVQACQSLLLYQSDMVLAGGISITFPQKRGYLHQEGGMVSEDGKCRTFDAGASGTVFGSGAGVVLLKRLNDAMADGDHVYAVIRGCGINNDGAAKVGYTAPSIEGQAAAIEMALADAGVEPRSISYVECHGTATPLGDPIEIAGLTRAFRSGTADRQFCAIGSVKTNIGHLDVAAGVVGLIKTALALKQRRLPPSLHFERPNPQIDFAATPFYVNSKLTEWSAADTPLRAGVSAFGVGGTNAHVILEEPPVQADAEISLRHAGGQLLVLSARSGAALDSARSRLALHLRRHPETNLADVCHTLQTGRRHFKHRCSISCRNIDEAIAGLEQPNPPVRATGVAPDRAPSLAFMFPGQGAQYPQMGRGLYDSEPEFRRHIDSSAEILKPLIGADLRELLYPAEASPLSATKLSATGFAQPALFAVEYALARLWSHWGVRPAAMIGHSVGEFVAATLAGVFSQESALLLIAERGRLMQDLPAGAMLAVRLPENEILPLLTASLSIAAVNGPSLCVVAGACQAIEELERMLQARDVSNRRLHTSHAFHSAMVEPILEPLRRKLAGIELSPPQLPWVSCVTGTWITPQQATSPDYWAGHARQPVRFADGISTLAAASGLLLEVGPGHTLATLAAPAARQYQRHVCASLPESGGDVADRDYIATALGRLWIEGVQPDWTAQQSAAPRRISLPSYPFERSRYWIEPPRRQAGRAIPAADPASDSPSTTPHIRQDIDTMSTPSVSIAADNHLAQSRAAVVLLLEELSGEALAACDPSRSFLEMGFDSLFLTQVSQRLQNQYKIKITFRQLLGEFSSIESLAALLADRLPAPAAVRAAATMPPPDSVEGKTKTHAPGTNGQVVPLPTPLAPLTPLADISCKVPQQLEGLMRDQLLAMSQLLGRQLETIQALGLSAPAAVPMAATLPAPPALAAAAPEQVQTASRFQVYNLTQRGSDSGLTPRQRQHIDSFSERYTRKTAGSKRLTQAYRQVLADPRAAAGFRSEWKELVYPIVCARAAGSRIWDVDGNEYIDLVNGYGQTAFGHAPSFVVDAVKHQLDLGFAIGPQAELAGKVAALFAELTSNERVTFCNTGSEAVMAALRVARSVTGRSKVVVFNGAYHGQFDEVLVKGLKRPDGSPRSTPVATGIPQSAVDNMVVLDYGTPAALQWIRDHAGDLAAVVVETVQSRHPEFLPLDFLRELRRITEASGTALVMDEVVTGFRVHPGGMQAVTGIRADLATYGKVVGGGLPIGILAGKAGFMDALDGGQWNYGDDSFPGVGVTFFAGTFVRHPLALAATWAVLNHVKEQGPALQQNLEAKTTTLVDSLNQLFQQRGLRTRVERYSSFFYFNIHHEHSLAGLLFHHLRDRGINVQDGFPCFLTTAHSDEDLLRIVSAFGESLSELQNVGILGSGPDAGPPPARRDIPLTESQTEIWLTAQQGDHASCAFNESVTMRMQGPLNQAALQRALDLLVARHEALRIGFDRTGESFGIAPQLDFSFATTDLSDRPEEAARAAFAALLDQDARTSFDLVNGPLFRGYLVRMAPELHLFVFTAHHIICDGWSVNILLNEFAELYKAQCQDTDAGLEAPMQFGEYAQALAAQSQDDAGVEAFWLKQFEQPPLPLELPSDRPRAAVKSFNGASHCRHIDAGLYQAIKKAGARQGCTLFVTLLAAFQALMGRLAGQNEVTVGVPTAGQSLLERGTLVGHCVNFLPIRGDWNGHTTIAQHLAATSRHVLEAREHQRYTLGTLVRKLDLRREMNRVPLTEIQFNLERLANRLQTAGLDIEVSPNPKAFVNFDLFLNVIESDSGLRLDCDYDTDLFDRATIDHWLDAYQELLRSFAEQPSRRVIEANYLSPAMRARMERLNNTAADYPRTSTVHELIEAQAAIRPDAPALMFGETSLTYRQLDRKANQLAHHLLDRMGPGDGCPGRLIGVSLSRSADMLIALLATLKAGCAYVPLDPTHPASRLRHILEDARVAALISDDHATVPPEGCVVVDPTRDAAAIAAHSPATPVNAAAANDLAYVIYTSGSTGLPKGVEVTHGAVVNFLTSMARRPGLTRNDVLLAVTTVSFDIAGLELFLPLAVGAKLVIAPTEALSDGFRLKQLIETSGASVLQATPASWELLLEAGYRSAAGFKMLCGGEGLPRRLADRLLEGDGELWNMYGPTETTIWSSCARILPGDKAIGVGSPIANTQFHILDQHDQPVLPGAVGQLHIGGDGVARGYHRRDELTAEKFIVNPFGSGRLYRSGDLARLTPDGDVRILGRIDHQIKLRGFRIELGEIETTLLSLTGIGGAVVLLREDVPDRPQLTAYFVDRAGELHAGPELRAILSQQLPDYMIPSAWVRLEALPLLPNGKLNRAALPAPEPQASGTGTIVEPSSPLEASLVKIWKEVLRVDRLGIEDDLFALGADSIHLFQITARANRAGIRVSARQMIRNRTIAALAKQLEGAATAVADRRPSTTAVPAAVEEPALSE